MRREAAAILGIGERTLGSQINRLIRANRLRASGPHTARVLTVIALDAPPAASAARELAPPAPPPVVRLPLAHPTAPMLHPMPIDELRERSDVFRCPPLSGTITAATCIDRQEIARSRPTGRGSQAVALRIAAAKFERCANCAHGRAVAKQLDAAKVAQTGT